MKIQNVLILSAALALAACGTPGHRSGGGSAAGASGGGYLAGDGPGSEDTAKLAAVPDAEPRDEPLHRYANRPYEALGVRYVPLAATGNYRVRGVASWYGKKFHGQRTSSGEVYNMYGMSAAHKTLPIPSYARVTNLRNGKSVIVRVNDRGPFVHDRLIDVSYAAAYKLGIIGSGSAEVEVEGIRPGQASPAVQTIAVDTVQVEPLAREPVAPVAASPAAPTGNDSTGRIFLQLGSFHSPQGAESFLASMRERLGDLGKRVVVVTQDGLTRVHLGPYRTADEARASADRLEPRLGFKPFVSLR